MSPLIEKGRSNRLGPVDIHVHRFRLDPRDDDLKRLESTLCDDEMVRARRLRTEALQKRFITGRGRLRHILGAYVERPPASLKFVYGIHGKPSLAESRGIEFNLAHSKDVALCAVTTGRAIGVDIEVERPLESAERIIQRFFSPVECAAFLALPQSDRFSAFYRAWARKEAFLKAIGTGLSTALDSFDVTLEPGKPAALLRVGDDPSEAARWWLGDLYVGEGLAAALAVAREEQEPAVILHDWAEPLDLACDS